MSNKTNPGLLKKIRKQLDQARILNENLHIKKLTANLEKRSIGNKINCGFCSRFTYEKVDHRS